MNGRYEEGVMMPEKQIVRILASLYMTSGDGRGVGSALGTGVLPVPSFPNVDPATPAVLPNRAD